MTWDEQIAVRTLWAECRGEPIEGQRAVAHVILNRVKSGRWGKSLASVCLARVQFSCWNASDPQRERMAAMQDDNPALIAMLGILNDAKSHPESNPVKDAMFYFSDSIPDPTWVREMTFVKKIGHHSFYSDLKP